MARTYLPTLVRLLHAVCTYITRYRDTILAHLPAGNEAKLDAVILACNALTALIDLQDEP